MGIINQLCRAAGDYAEMLKEKNSRAAVINRLRMVIRCEEKAADQEYMALGRYYYNALRDKDNALAESHCARIDEISARRDSALEALERVTHEASSIAVISGYDSECDGSLEERAEEKKTLFHFEQGPLTVTVTKDEPAQREEIDLSDVEVYDQDPTLSVETASVQPAAEAGPEIQPAEPDENDGLPFEG